MARGLSPESPGRRVRMIFMVYCIVLLCVCVVSWPYVIYIFYCYGTIWPVCAESAVKYQANKHCFSVGKWLVAGKIVVCEHDIGPTLLAKHCSMFNFDVGSMSPVNHFPTLIVTLIKRWPNYVLLDGY